MIFVLMRHRTDDGSDPLAASDTPAMLAVYARGAFPTMIGKRKPLPVDYFNALLPPGAVVNIGEWDSLSIEKVKVV